MLIILCKRGEIAPEEQFLLLSTIFCYLMLDFYVKTGMRFSLRDKRLFEIIEVEIMRVNCIKKFYIHKITKFSLCTYQELSDRMIATWSIHILFSLLVVRSASTIHSIPN